MAWCKTIVIPSHVWRSYNSFAPTHPYLILKTDDHFMQNESNAESSFITLVSYIKRPPVINNH